MKNKLSRRVAITLATVAVIAAIVPSTVAVQTATWPTKAVTIVVPVAPGGAGHGSVRILSEVISPQLGQPMLVDNRPGAGGITGT